MTAIIDDTHKVIDCPHCKGKLEVEIERKPATVKVRDDTPQTEYEAFTGRIDKLESKIVDKAKDPEVEYPSFYPGEYCASGNCEFDGVHPNENYKRRAGKQCTNCDQLAPSSATKCAWCDNNEFDDVPEDVFKEKGIKLPKLERHHNHDSHE